jgi:hypothetical protein
MAEASPGFTRLNYCSRRLVREQDVPKKKQSDDIRIDSREAADLIADPRCLLVILQLD